MCFLVLQALLPRRFLARGVCCQAVRLVYGMQATEALACQLERQFEQGFSWLRRTKPG